MMWSNFFICLFVICISLLMRYLLWCLAHSLIRLFVFLLVNFKSSSYILDNNPFSIGALQVFLFPVCDMSFHSLDSVFHRAEKINFYSSPVRQLFFS